MNIIDYLYHGKLGDTHVLTKDSANLAKLKEKVKEEFFSLSTQIAQKSPQHPVLQFDIRGGAEKRYTVATYFISTKDVGLRPGGYFALSLFIENEMPRSRSTMYGIFQKYHDELLKHNIISETQIRISSFDEKKDFLFSLADELVKAINSQCKDVQSISSISPITSNSINNSQMISLDDCDSQYLFNILKGGEKVFVSPNFQSLQIIAEDYKKKYESEHSEQLLTQQKNQKNEDTPHKKPNTKDPRDKDQQEEISNLRAENNELKSQIESIKKVLNKKISKAQGGIGAVRKNIAEVREEEKQNGSGSIWSKFILLIPFFNLLLLIVLIYLISSNLDILKKNTENPKDTTDHPTVVETGTTDTDGESSNGKEDFINYGPDITNPGSEPLPNPATLGTTTNTKYETKDIIIQVFLVKDSQLIDISKKERQIELHPKDILVLRCNNTQADYDWFGDINCYKDKDVIKQIATEFNFYNKTNKTDIIALVKESTNDNIMIWYCLDKEKDIPFEQQKNKRNYKYKK